MLEGKRINLRLFKEEDISKFVELTSNIMKNGEYWFGDPPSEGKVKKRFNETGFWEQNSGDMLITDKQDKLVGSISFFKPTMYFNGYEIGYRIYRPEDRGKGYTTEALKIFTPFLFGTKPIHRLQICAAVDNIPSWKVAEKCGFKYEGTLRGALFSKGRYLDLKIYSILRDECPTIDEALKNL